MNKLYSVQLICDVTGFTVATYNFWNLEAALAKMLELTPLWKFEIHDDNAVHTIWYGK